MPLTEISDDRLAAATEDHWKLCACSWCFELERRKAHSSSEEG